MRARLRAARVFVFGGESVRPASTLQAARLAEHLRQWAKYGQGGFRELQSGRIRYFDVITSAGVPGTMQGRRLVREWDPATGAHRTRFETLDEAGRLRQVRPETRGPKRHYVLNDHGKYEGSW